MIEWKPDYRLAIDITWTPRREPDGQLTLEEHVEGDTRRTVFGPFSAELLEQFVAERKAYFEALRDSTLSHLRSLPDEAGT